MKRFKTIDVWVSGALIISFLLLALLQQGGNFIYGYFVVGSWQIISMLTHTGKGWFTERGGRRRVYHYVVTMVLCAVLLGFLVDSLLFFLLYGLLYASPFMALYYLWLCYHETYVKMKRPLEVLK
jgi:hypothetical protein